MSRILGLERAGAVAVTAAFLVVSGAGLPGGAASAETRIEDLPFAVDHLLNEPEGEAAAGPADSPADVPETAGDPVAVDPGAPAGETPVGETPAGEMPAVGVAPAPLPVEPQAQTQPPSPAATSGAPVVRLPVLGPPPQPARTGAAARPAVGPGVAADDLEGRLGFRPEALAGIPWSPGAVKRFYGLVGGAGPIWTGAGRDAAAVPAVLDVMARAAEEGLDPADYPLGTIKRLLAAGEAPAAEVLITDAVIRYAADRTGARLATVRLPPDMRELGPASDAVRLAADAALSAAPAAALSALGPQDAGYVGLRQLLARYRQIARAGGWPSLASDGPKIEPGQVDPRVTLIRKRLSLTDGVPATAPQPGDSYYDPALRAAIERFQARHGLTPDGVIGKNTLRELGREVDFRIRQIIVNMERRRQRLDADGPDGIVVNIPEFALRYWEKGTLVLKTKVIVGRVSRKSPLLSSRVSSVIINPTWTVPSKLAGEDIVRHVLENPNYIEEHGFTIYSGWGEDAEIIDPATIDWTMMPRNKSFPFRLRQRPGADNSLGVLKINFANKYAVYMHDTPDRHLFTKELRAISSGCVRVMNPLDLVEHLLAGTAWRRDRIESRIGGELTWIGVNRDIPVRFTYVTAWVDDKGLAQFRDDLYGIDQRIASSLGHPVRITAESEARPVAAAVP